MNSNRRAELNDVIDLLDEAKGRLEEIRDDEQDSFDNLSDGLQYSRTGQSMEIAIATMDSLINEIEEVEGHVREFQHPKKKK